MNSFFASVEQQEQPHLRNAPVVVAPMITNTTCAISASYQARAYGIKTGTSVADAKVLCPAVRVVAARPKLYVQYNRAIVELLHHFFVEIEELSVDEMACYLPPSKKNIEAAINLAKQVKAFIKKKLGEALRCSIGIAPNIFLAKVASDFQKPDGLTLFVDDYTEKLFSLSLTDLPGIAKRNEQRLRSCGIYTVKDLWDADFSKLRSVWGGTVGERWHYMLRGNLQIDYSQGTIGEQKKSVSQSHVLPPQFRTIPGARDMLLRLTAKALRRLRSYNQAPKAVYARISFRHKESWGKKLAWEVARSYPVAANDDLCWLPMIHQCTSTIAYNDEYRPVKVTVCFSDLYSTVVQQSSFLEDRTRYFKLFQAIDRIRSKLGAEVNVAQIFHLSKEAPFRISFGGVVKDKLE
jgi:DNA polymerase-4